MSSFLIITVFICLLALARTSVMLGRSGDSRHDCLICDLKRETLIISPLSVMFGEGVYPFSV